MFARIPYFVANGMLGQLIQSVVDLCNREDTREVLETRVVTPLVHYLAERFAWTVRLFQVVAVLVFFQTIILLWLLMREVRRPPLV